MIETLRIENLAIVEEAELELGPGLNVLTGETGAGKSIVLGALSLLVGARADAGALREGATQGGVEASFRTEAAPALEEALRARDLAPVDVEDADRHEVVVRRTLTASGRSRARVGGQMVPVSTLSELLGERVEISSQHSSQALLRPESHGLLLDEAGGLLALREQVAERFDALRALDEELARLRERAAERERARDFLAFQLAEIDEVGLEPGELVTLEADHGRLAHAESLRSDGAEALAALRGGDDGAGDGATDRLAAALRVVEHMARMDPGLADRVGQLRALDDELADVARELERYVDRIDGDPATLARLDDRIAQVERLRRKYGHDEAEIFARRESLAGELDALEGADARVGILEQERAGRLAALDEAAQALSAGRRKAAKKLARAVEAGLHDLAMPEARFAVRLEASASRGSWPDGATSGPTGAEAPEFEMSANAGGSLRPLRKVASGGELSRVFLAVKNALRQAGGGMVLVFDEVDAGVGGRAAERVGRALAELATHHQVICITHLPQIAAFATRHFRVEKSADEGRTRARVTPLEEGERVEEIARMAGGEAITEATRRHARALIRAAGGPRG